MNIKRLNRYTTLPVLLDLLERKKLVLLDPKSWEDKNDSEVLLEYKKRKSINKLFVLCFSYGQETIHHWKSYSNGISGCCVEFDAKALRKIFKKIEHLRYGIVKYKKVKDVEAKSIPLDEMPFTKRWPYRCEEEFRIIWEGKTKSEFYEIPIELNVIKKITISQQMPKQVFITIRNYLKTAFKDPEKRINRSTLYENKRWINSFKRSDNVEPKK